MEKKWQRSLLPILILVALLLSSEGRSNLATAGEQDVLIYLPLIAAPPVCPTSSNNSYTVGPAFQYDLDNPVRPAWNHADKNLALRGYTPNTDSGLKRELVDYGSDDPVQPPQMPTLFAPARVPALIAFYQVHQWNWAPSPDPGTRGPPQTTPPVTALGLATTPGEPLHVPTSGYSIGGGAEVLLLFADEDTVHLRYTREDSAGSPGYSLYVDGLCTDPNLLALYNATDHPDGPRYDYVPPSQRPYSYDLPQLPAGQIVGTARTTEVVLAIVDSGTFMDPRSCNEWWQIRPGYGGSCPPP